MNPQTFMELDIHHRAQLLWNDGIYIDTRAIYGKTLIKLYYYAGLYVEVLVNMSTNQIQEIIPISEEEVLDVYVDLSFLL